MYLIYNSCIYSWRTWDSNPHRCNSRLHCMSPHSYGFEAYVCHDFLIGYCFNQEQRRPNVGLLEHLLRAPQVRYNVFHPFHAVAFLVYPHLITNFYRYSKPYPPHLIVPHPAPFHPIQHLPALHYLAPLCSHTPDIHCIEQPFQHARPQTILFMSTQTKPRMRSSS